MKTLKMIFAIVVAVFALPAVAQEVVINEPSVVGISAESLIGKYSGQAGRTGKRGQNEFGATLTISSAQGNEVQGSYAEYTKGLCSGDERPMKGKLEAGEILHVRVQPLESERAVACPGGRNIVFSVSEGGKKLDGKKANGMEVHLRR